MESLKRVAGGEAPSLSSQMSEAPPAHDIFCQHFLRCFVCHIGDRYIEDHFCEEGRDLMVAMLDELAEREFRAGEIADSRLTT